MAASLLALAKSIYYTLMPISLRTLLRIIRKGQKNQTVGKMELHHACSKRKSLRPRCSKRKGKNATKTGTIKGEVNT